MRRLILQVLVVSAVAALAVKAPAAESKFYERFQAAKDEDGFIWDTSLVDTNNSGPVLTNAPISYAGFARRGELAGIKLGMTMSEVVAAWGKPHRFFKHCFIGPRFWYGTRWYGHLSLSFSEDRLVLIGIQGSTAENITFDNGLTGMMGRAQCERLLGPPTLASPDTRGTLYAGEIAYRVGKFRTDLNFNHISARGTSGPTEQLFSIAVCLESEAGRQSFVEPDGPANASQPARTETNGTSSAAGSRR